MAVRITGAEITDDDGTVVALVEGILVGGGENMRGYTTAHEEIWVKDEPTRHYHVRLLAPDRMIPDELLMVDTYDQAIEVGQAYVAKRARHAETIAQFQAEMAGDPITVPDPPPGPALKLERA